MVTLDEANGTHVSWESDVESELRVTLFKRLLGTRAEQANSRLLVDNWLRVCYLD